MQYSTEDLEQDIRELTLQPDSQAYKWLQIERSVNSYLNKLQLELADPSKHKNRKNIRASTFSFSSNLILTRRSNKACTENVK